MTKLRAEVVRFLEAQAMLTLARADQVSADLRHRRASMDFRRAWDALTPAEAEMVNEACRALEEPETTR